MQKFLIQLGPKDTSNTPKTDPPKDPSNNENPGSAPLGAGHPSATLAPAPGTSGSAPPPLSPRSANAGLSAHQALGSGTALGGAANKASVSRDAGKSGLGLDEDSKDEDLFDFVVPNPAEDAWDAGSDAEVEEDLVDLAFDAKLAVKEDSTETPAKVRVKPPRQVIVCHLTPDQGKVAAEILAGKTPALRARRDSLMALLESTTGTAADVEAMKQDLKPDMPHNYTADYKASAGAVATAAALSAGGSGVGSSVQQTPSVGGFTKQWGGKTYHFTAAQVPVLSGKAPLTLKTGAVGDMTGFMAVVQQINRENGRDPDIMPTKSELKHHKVSNGKCNLATFTDSLRDFLGCDKEQVAAYFELREMGKSGTGGKKGVVERQMHADAEQRYNAKLLMEFSEQKLQGLGIAGKKGVDRLTKALASVIMSANALLPAGCEPVIRLDPDHFNGDRRKLRGVVQVVSDSWWKDKAVFEPGFAPSVLRDVMPLYLDAVEGSIAEAGGSFKQKWSRPQYIPQVPWQSDMRRYIPLGNCGVDYCSKEMLAECRKKGGVAVFVITHIHFDHTKFFNRRYLWKAVLAGEAVVICTAATAAALLHEANPMKFEYLSRIPFRILEPGEVFNIPGTSSALLLGDNGHCPGSVFVTVFDLKNGNTVLHGSETRFVPGVHSNFTGALDTIQDVSGCRPVVKAAIMDDTNWNVMETSTRSGALSAMLKEAEPLWISGSYRTIVHLFSDYKASGKGKVVRDFAAASQAYSDGKTLIYLLPESFAIVEAFHRAGAPGYEDISCFRRLDPAAPFKFSTAATNVIMQIKPQHAHKDAIMGTVEAVYQANKEDLDASGDPTAVLIHLLAGFMRPFRAENLEGTSFAYARMVPIKCTDHSCFPQIVEQVQLLQAYGLKKEDITLLIAEPNEIAGRVDKIWEHTGKS